MDIELTDEFREIKVLATLIKVISERKSLIIELKNGK